MSVTRNLNNFYGGFFTGAALFGVSPYLVTFNAGASCGRPNEYNVDLGLLACIFFTCAVPVLPTFTALTMSLAVTAVILAAMSMIVAYPLALAIDLAENDLCSSSYGY